jgi:formylglycine-generating enzyme required for sulfatase activity
MWFMDARYRDDLIAAAHDVLALDWRGRPCCHDSQAIFSIMRALRRSVEPATYEELVTGGFLAGAAERYERYIAASMRSIAAVRYEMGTPPDEVKHFCGESPRHEVELSPFTASAYAVTNELYAIFDARRNVVSKDLQASPVSDVTWFDAAVFGLWVGCRLPTEAEWEYLCGAGSETMWCCADARDLPAYAWYSENAEDYAHPVGTRQPNALGMYDMHGNVWEWCADDYSSEYYASAPLHNPLNEQSATNGTAPYKAHKVSRGGGFYALAEMCRTQYRLHDPGYYRAPDLGFRLVRGTQAYERINLC